jgi:tetratricopeptide (TPR) repeat protein
VDDRLYRILKYTALAMVLGWIGWSIYDGFVKPRDAESVAAAAAHRAFADGQYQRAYEGYSELLRADPGDLDARRGVARTLLQMQRYDEALAQFNRAIEADPDFGATYANRGILHDRMGRYERALADYRRAIELDPEVAEGPGWLTRFLRNQPKVPTVGARAEYLAAELKKPPGERHLRDPEKDAQQRSYRLERPAAEDG